MQALASSQRHAAVQLHISGNLTNLPLFDRVKARPGCVPYRTVCMQPCAKQSRERNTEAAEDLSRCFRLMDVVVSHDTSSAHDKAQEVQLRPPCQQNQLEGAPVRKVRQALQDGHVEIFWRKRAGGRAS